MVIEIAEHEATFEQLAYREIPTHSAREVRPAVEKKLANENFVKRADPEVVEAERERQGELTLELELLNRNLAGF